MHYGIISGRVTLFPVRLTPRLDLSLQRCRSAADRLRRCLIRRRRYLFFREVLAGIDTAFASEITVEMCNSVGQMTRGVHAEVRFRHGPVDR
jgi:hypothetical protein